MKLAVVGGLVRTPENRVWFRAINTQHLSTALAVAHSRRMPSRFSTATQKKRSFPLLYLSENQQVAMFEVGAILGSPYDLYVPNPTHSWVLLNVQVTLQQVADLTDVAVQKRLRTTAQELTGDWRGYQLRQPTSSVKQPTGLAPTQLLGAALYAVDGLEGFRVPSVPMPTHMNLVVFPDKLLPGSSLAFHDPASGRTHTLKPKRARRGAT